MGDDELNLGDKPTVYINWCPIEESILTEAERIVNGERQADYSNPVANFTKISNIASAIIGKEVSPRDCCIVMIAVKLAREAYKHKRDNLVDLAGYAEILNRIQDEKGNEG
mgnify:CR=1 FL=1